MAPPMLSHQPPNTLIKAKPEKNDSVGILLALNKEYHSKHAEVNWVSRREDKLEKKAFKVILFFKNLFRNIQFITSCEKGRKRYE